MTPICAILVCAALAAAKPPADAGPEGRAIAFLAREVPAWARENKCYSCHNNGDAARALFAAARAGMLDQREPIADTLAFLGDPKHWDANGPEGPFKDKKLARIQFAAALAEAGAAGLVKDREALATAAGLVAELQTADGSWETDAPGTIGSPVTYGRALATWMATRTLEADGAAKHRPALAKARAWFGANEPKSVLDAAATLLALAEVDTDSAREPREQALEIVRRGQSDDGGWGPFASAPPEAFDTAVVLLALAAQQDRRELAPLVDRGRAYLVAQQSDDGGWPATTRPPGVDSYAQRLSTSAWATSALIATRGQSRR
jgi:hypothetical protein